MPTPASESFPEAPRELRRQLYDGIGSLVTRWLMPQIGDGLYEHLPESMVPAFVRDRLPVTDRPVSYSARVMRLNGAGAGRRSLGIMRTAVHEDFTHFTDWQVSHTIAGPREDYTATRTIEGEERQLRPPLPPDIEPNSFDHVMWRIMHAITHDSDQRMPSPEIPGTWPEAALVVPEAEQMLALIAALQPPGSGG